MLHQRPRGRREEKLMGWYMERMAESFSETDQNNQEDSRGPVSF